MLTLPSTGPKYRQIADDLTARLRGGEYRPGALLPTLADLGQHYEVSQITVQQAVRILADQGLVRTVRGKGTIATGAVAEAPAGAGRVAVLLPNLRHWALLHTTLVEELHALGQDALMQPLLPDTDFQRQLDVTRGGLDALNPLCRGGFILFGERNLVERFQRCRRSCDAVVCLENGNGVTDVPLVTSDNFGGMVAVTRHLLSLGHRRLAYVDPALWEDPGHDWLRPGTTREQRWAGFRAALRASRLAPCMPDDLLKALREPFDAEGLGAVLRRPDAPTALVCRSDGVAWRVCQRLEEAGLRVPEDVSVTGYDNELIDSDGDRRGREWLTSLDHNAPELARRLVHLLYAERDRLENRRTEAPARILVPPILHARASAAPPPR